MTILIPHYRTARRGASGLPLDNYTTNLWAAWSTRKLLTAWAGNSMNLNRVSGGGSQVVGFVNNILDTATVATFGSGTTAYPIVVYDQSGNARNAGIGGSAPVIYDGTGQRYINSMPALYWDTSTDNLSIGTKPAANKLTIFATFKTIASRTVVCSDSASGFVGIAEDGVSTSNAINSGTSACYVDGSLVGTTRNDLYDAACQTPATRVVAATASSLTGWSSAVRFFGYGGYSPTGMYVVDCIIYDTELTAGDISAISSKLIAGI